MKVFMKENLILLILLLLVVVNLHSSFAQAGEVGVLVRQVSSSTYIYKIINYGDKPIVSVTVGRNYSIDDSENELLVLPTTIESPMGWGGYNIFREESDYYHISWDILDYTFAISPGGSLDGFVVYMLQPYDLIKQVSFSVIFNDGTITSGKVELDNDNDGYPSDVDCDDNDPIERPNQTWYQDADNDGYSTGNSIIQCLRPTGYKTASELTATSGDCNDNSVAINPAATEVCDGVDNNCNGQIDEGVLNTYYQDADSDTYGNPNVTIQACIPPNGYVTNNTDCNDNDANIHPGGLPIRIMRTPSVYFSSLQAAYDAAEDGKTIQSLAVTLTENPTLNLNKSVILDGGYNCDYSSQTGITMLKGTITISNGTAMIGNFSLEP
jgi:hypothetical protein